MIPLHRPYISEKALTFIEEAFNDGQLSGNGKFTQYCQSFFQNQYGLNKCLLTNSCTSALEMAALLINIQPGDEVIVPSYTYVSSANPFLMRGAELVFADSESSNPNIDASCIETLITSKTKAIVVMHYAGIACDMESIMALAEKHDVFVIEDAAHSLGAYWKDKPLGGIGHLGAYSFHSTKNISSGQGGLLIINDDSLVKRADILWEKGTNRKDFINGRANKYEWHDIGSSFYPSELTAALLWAQIQSIKKIQSKLLELWNYYQLHLQESPGIELPKIPEYAKHNAHLFFLKVSTPAKRNELITYLNQKGIGVTFHYLALHQSPFWKDKKDQKLKNSEDWETCCLRLPLYFTLSKTEQDFIIDTLKKALS